MCLRILPIGFAKPSELDTEVLKASFSAADKETGGAWPRKDTMNTEDQKPFADSVGSSVFIQILCRRLPCDPVLCRNDTW